MKLPTYTLVESWTFRNPRGDDKVMEKGTFVHPIRECYVPKHIKENSSQIRFTDEPYIFIHSKYGFAYVPQRIVKEVQ